MAEWSERPHLRACPVIIIDDEADQASINTATGENITSARHGLIRDLLNRLPKAAYVGYTATPFANVFIDPSDDENLYPRDFIITLQKPDGYFGASDIFGRERISEDEPDSVVDGLNMVRLIRNEELAGLRPTKKAEETFSPKVVESLSEAVAYFFLATAARRAREEIRAHSTMLVHTSQMVDVHQQFLPILKQQKELLLRELEVRDSTTHDIFGVLWHREIHSGVNDRLGIEPVTFEELLPELPGVIQDTEIVMENYLADPNDRLDYSGDPKTYIVVGGNVLARGLTLEGLVVSYFIRSSSAYDTLLQMGRWFGYRKGYMDLPRIWMTEELRGYFFDLALVEQELRIDANRHDLETETPLTFAPRIRVHPSLSITARMKMRAAVPAEVSYALSAIQTRLFHHRNHTWLEDNVQAWIRLAANLKSDPTQCGAGRYLYRDVDVHDILQSLKSYHFHENSADLNSMLLEKYIQQEIADGGFLERWNVGIVGKKGEPKRPADIPLLGLEMDLIERSRLKNGDAPYADIGGYLMLDGFPRRPCTRAASPSTRNAALKW